MAEGHEVVVLTRANNKDVIKSYIETNSEEFSNIRFVYFDLNDHLLKWKKLFGAHELYYVLWQRKARKIIDILLQEEDFDLVHLVTFASFRYPVFLGHLKVPVVWGPVGGGETAPWRLLWYRIRFPACIKEIMRNFGTYLSSLLVRWIDPTRTSGGRVVASTPATRKILLKRGLEAKLMPTIGVDVDESIERVDMPLPSEGIRFIFVGRLVLLKGAHLLLEAFAEAQIPGASVTLAGDGSERGYLESLARRLGVDEQVHFLGQVAKEDLPALYASHHVVVAPSLYESGGYMVLEGFQKTRPSIVLDVGGLSMSVDSSCGIKVPQGSGDKVVEGLAEAMRCYAEHSDLIERHGRNGLEKLRKVYDWAEKGKRMARIYEEAAKSRMR